ncbi:MAG: hypothetical protein ACP5VE_10695 [Chthonomonadales bacterium]
MKAAAVILGVALVASAGWLVVPRLLRSAPPGGAKPQSALFGAPLKRSQPLEPPQTREEEVRRRFTRERLPLFRYIQEQYGSVVTGIAEGEELDTLEITLARGDAETLQRVMTGALIPYGREYGFRYVRFYIPSPPGSPDPRTLIAEASCNDEGRWTLFPK